MKRNITILQAFNAMDEFLEEYYQRTKSDAIGVVLGELSFLSDGSTADPAAWYFWNKAIKKNLKHGTDTKLTELQAFNTMLDFFEEYYPTEDTNYLEEMLQIKLFLSKAVINPVVWGKWNQAVQKAIEKGPNYKRYLEIHQS